MRVSAYASQPHYRRHLEPVVAALLERGVEADRWCPDGPWGEHPTDASRHRVAPLVLVASPVDADRWRDRWVVFVEHGAGQHYEGVEGNRSFRQPGSPGLDQVLLFLVPNPEVGARYTQAYPQARVVVVGCPALDRHLRFPGDAPPASLPQPARRCVAFTAHWSMGAGFLPEADPALPHFAPVLPHVRIDLARAGIEMLGHAHPKAAGQMSRFWSELGVPFEPDPDVVLERADLLVVDNSSLAFEMAALDKPVLLLNHPNYRRDVEHGGRFWSAVPGLQCDDPADLPHAIRAALDDDEPCPTLRRRGVAWAYSFTDGRAAWRAAEAIHALELPGGQPPMPPNPEVRDRLDEMLERLVILGAADATVDAVRQGWNTGTDEERFAYRERLRRMNDVSLSAEIRLAEADLEPDEESESNGTAATVRGDVIEIDDEVDA